MSSEKKLPFATTEQKYNKSRTRHAQRTGQSNANVKRRVNITINGELWDHLDDLGVENKSSIIQEFIEQYIKEHEEQEDQEG